MLRTTSGAEPADDKSATSLANAEEPSGSGGSDDRNPRNAEPAAEPEGGESCQPGANEPSAEAIDAAFNAIAGALAGVADELAGSAALMVSAAIARYQGIEREAFLDIAGQSWDSAGKALAAGAITLEHL